MRQNDGRTIPKIFNRKSQSNYKLITKALLEKNKRMEIANSQMITVLYDLLKTKNSLSQTNPTNNIGTLNRFATLHNDQISNDITEQNTKMMPS